MFSMPYHLISCVLGSYHISYLKVSGIFHLARFLGRLYKGCKMLVRGGLIHQFKKWSYTWKGFQLSFDKSIWSLSCLSYAFVLLFQLQHHMFLIKGKIVNQSKLCYCYIHGLVFLLGHLSLQFISYHPLTLFNLCPRMVHYALGQIQFWWKNSLQENMAFLIGRLTKKYLNCHCVQLDQSAIFDKSIWT